jgi:hypothetical protein
MRTSIRSPHVKAQVVTSRTSLPSIHALPGFSDVRPPYVIPSFSGEKLSIGCSSHSLNEILLGPNIITTP